MNCSGKTITWLLIYLFINPLAIAAPISTQDPRLKGIDLNKVQELKSTKLSEYLKSNSLPSLKESFERDFLIFTKNADQLGIFEDSTEFLIWWEKNKTELKSGTNVNSLKEKTMSVFVTKMYLRFAAEKAKKIDEEAAGKAKEQREKNLPTAGDIELMNKLTKANDNAWSPWLIGTIAGGAAVVAAKISDVFFHGPIAQIMNTSLEPVIRPVRERIDLAINTHVAPHLVGWAQFVTGENRRRKRAKANASAGKELSAGTERYQHPAIGVDDFTDDTKKFYDEFLKADYAWRGWIAPELGRARNTGFELLYHQYRLLGEQMNSAQIASNQNKLVQKQVNIPALLEAGATKEDIEEFSALILERQDLQVYKDLKDPRIKIIEPKVKAILDKWTQKGISEKAITAYYEGILQTSITNNRPAFLLASVLDGERYFQENNLALKNMPQIQAWQEQAREMTGFYEELAKHEENIQKFFIKKGLKYNVAARIAERGYPLGGKIKPQDAAPIGDCVRDYFKLQLKPNH